MRFRKTVPSWLLWVLALEAGGLASATFSFEPPWTDSILYIGLARNLVSGVGYYDNIRMDEVLPPIGHPLLLAAGQLLQLSPAAMGHVALAAAFTLLFVAWYFLTRSLVASAGLTAALVWLVPSTLSVGGIEQSVLLSSALAILSFTVTLTGTSRRAAAAMGLCLACSQLLRPLLVPLLFTATAAVGVSLAGGGVRTQAAMQRVAIYLGTFVLAIAMVMGLSQALYGDQRLTTGTVGGIGLYCSYNKYLNLKESYASDRWLALPKSVRGEAMRPLDRRGRPWMERDRELKQLAFQYIREHPRETWSAFRWRFSKYSVNTPWTHQRVLWWLFVAATSILLVSAAISRNGQAFLLAGIASGVALYMMTMQAAYSFVGEPRHLMAMVPFLFQPAVMVVAGAAAAVRGRRVEARGSADAGLEEVGERQNP